jgi:hypothetical protein
MNYVRIDMSKWENAGKKWTPWASGGASPKKDRRT